MVFQNHAYPKPANRPIYQKIELIVNIVHTMIWQLPYNVLMIWHVFLKIYFTPTFNKNNLIFLIINLNNFILITVKNINFTI